MKNDSSKNEIATNVPEKNFWDSQESIQQKEDVIKCQNTAIEMFEEKFKTQSENFVPLLKDLLEIADVILKNTSGIGSNFKLAECDLSKMSRETMEVFINHVLIMMSYHFGQLIPDEKDALRKIIQEIVGDEKLFQSWEKELSTFKDHENGTFSSVRAGRALWEKAAVMFGIQNSKNNTTARIYYQTALGQDLMYILENSENERWLNFR